jgi:hypothetical protein
MGRVLALFVFAIVSIWPLRVEAGGKLDRVRSEVRGDAPSPKAPSSSGNAPSSRGSSRPPVGYATPDYGTPPSSRRSTRDACCGGSPSTVELGDARRTPAEKTVVSYGSYPYEYGNRHYVRRLSASQPEDRDLFAGTAHVEGGYAGAGVWRAGGGLALRVWRIGLDNDVHWLVDPKHEDSLYLGTTNATFAIVMQPPFVWRLGPGVNYMIDGRVPGGGTREYAAGFNASTTMDIIPIKPVILSGRFDWGRIWKAETMTVRGTIGWIVQRWEIYAGYEYERVGDTPLGGPIAGVRAWY